MLTKATVYSYLCEHEQNKIRQGQSCKYVANIIIKCPSHSHRAAYRLRRLAHLVKQNKRVAFMPLSHRLEVDGQEMSWAELDEVKL